MLSKLTTCLMLLAIAGCVERVDIDHSPCPCPEGWTCVGKVCVRPGPGPDGAVGDVVPAPDRMTPVPDASPKKHTVTFAHGKSASSMTLATINYDGTGYQKVPGYGDLHMNYSIHVGGRVNQVFPFTGDVPQVLSNLPYRPILLPHGIGQIRYFRDHSGGQYREGVMLVRPGGDVQQLYSASGSLASSNNVNFAVSDDGKWVASHDSSANLVILMRTDGKQFSNGKSHLALKMPPTPIHIYSASVTLTNKWLYVITREDSSSSSKHLLWRAPADGSKPLATISLPLVNGLAPTWIDEQVAFSAKGDTAVITAGSKSGLVDVISIDGSGKAVNVSRQPADYEERGGAWGSTYGWESARLDISPAGKHVAYVRRKSSSIQELHVARADGSGFRHFVTSPANFTGLYRHPYSVKWIDDDNLIFVVLSNNSHSNDIFRFQVSTATVTNLTKNTPNTKPFTLGSGNMFLHGMWLSPNRRWLYFLAQRKATPVKTIDVDAVDLTTWKTRSITSGAEVFLHPDSFAACSKKPLLFFAAEPKAVSNTQDQLFMLDMNAGTTAVQLTNIKQAPGSTTDWNVQDIMLSADCGVVAFRSGESKSNYFDVHVVRMSPPPAAAINVTKVNTSAHHHVFDYLGISADNSLLIYFSGTSSSTYAMNQVSLLGNCCKPKTIHKGGSAFQHWLLFGIN